MTKVDPNKFSRNRDAALEAKLKALTEAADEDANKKKEEAESREEDKRLSEEESTYKKRYGDLRRHQQAQEAEFKEKMRKLEEQLTAATKKEVELPTTEEEFNDWVQKYPALYKVIRTAIIKENKEEREKLDEIRKKVSDEEKAAEIRRARAEFLEAHPDFPQIKEDVARWLKTQPSYLYDALHKNETNALAAIRAVDLYKADMEKTSPEVRKKKEREAAESVRAGAVAAPSEGEKKLKYYESDLKQLFRLPTRELEKIMPDIDEARQHPEFYDISGAAR